MSTRVLLVNMLTLKLLQKRTIWSTSSYTELGLLFSPGSSDVFCKHKQPEQHVPVDQDWWG